MAIGDIVTQVLPYVCVKVLRNDKGQGEKLLGVRC